MPHPPPKTAPPAQDDLRHESAQEPRAGALYVVATPIGNLNDLSPRARAILAGVDAIAAEDTRTSGVLLKHFGIEARLVALHEHNEDRVSPELVASLKRGECLALISDAGTPLVSDPGFALVRAARAAGVQIYAVPGPSASRRASRLPRPRCAPGSRRRSSADAASSCWSSPARRRPPSTARPNACCAPCCANCRRRARRGWRRNSPARPGVRSTNSRCA